jgi:hypothetical protein
MTSPMTREERLAIIKIAADRVAARNAFKTKAKKSAVKAILLAKPEKELKRKKEREFQDKIDAMDENHNHWTDAPKYAKQYYGDVYRDTTKFDNEWN